MKVFVRYNFLIHSHTKMVCFEEKQKIFDFVFLHKDFTIWPSIWLGTSAGCVIVVNLNITYEPRNISGTISIDDIRKRYD